MRDEGGVIGDEVSVHMHIDIVHVHTDIGLAPASIHTHTHTYTHTQDFGIGPIIRHATVSHVFGLRPDMPHPPVGRMCSL